MTVKELKGNIQPFEKEFICAGARSSIISLYRKLVELGANCDSADKALLSSKSPVVLFCKNNGISGKFAEVRVLSRSWWDYWHNPKNKRSMPKYKTYNLPRQWDIVLEKLITVKNYPLYHEASKLD